LKKVVGSLAVVTRPTEPWKVYIGVPARPVKNCSKKLLELKKEYLEEELTIPLLVLFYNNIFVFHGVFQQNICASENHNNFFLLGKLETVAFGGLFYCA
jgi:hypothetical protein